MGRRLLKKKHDIGLKELEADELGRVVSVIEVNLIMI